MNRFAALVQALETGAGTTARVAALVAYFRSAPPRDRLWTVALMSGRRPRRAVSTTELRAWAAEAAGLPEWLVAESHSVAGDLAETIALILPPGQGGDARPLSDWMDELIALRGQPAGHRRAAVLAAWDGLPPEQRFVFNKLLTGGFRIGVSQGLILRALAQVTGQPEAVLAHRLMGSWDPTDADWHSLIEAPGDQGAADLSRPYPFCLAHPLDEGPAPLGPAADWLAEWKWDGIRAQLILRGGQVFLWSRGQELLTDRFPEMAPLAGQAEAVLDGELLAWAEGPAPLPFAALQRRIGRKSVPRRLLAEAPARLIAYDLLELDGADLRDRPLDCRRALLAGLVARLGGGPVRLSPEVAGDWTGRAAARAAARDLRAEGLMLKRRAAPYHAGRRRGDWWKWKLDPMSVDAVMIYAQAGHGRRANLFSDFTFAVWQGTTLVPFAKAYSGLSDAEFARITRWVRANTLERFGPVRRVRPELVFEIAFEGIQDSPRHKSGIALRFPRIARWRTDKTPDQADRIETLRALLDRPGPAPHVLPQSQGD